MTKSAEEWILYAENDFSAAKFLMESHRPPYEIIAYHCQQAAEKYLKALLVEQKQLIPRTHDLGILLEKVSAFYSDLEDITEICDRLTPFGVVTRYPGSSMTVGKEHMDFVISAVEKIRDAVRSAFNNE